jgi:hypothetical protein
MLLCDFLGVNLFLVECLVPAADVAVAALDVEERRLVECLDGLSVALFEGNVTNVSIPADGPSLSQVNVKTRRLSCTISR